MSQSRFLCRCKQAAPPPPSPGKMNLRLESPDALVQCPSRSREAVFDRRGKLFPWRGPPRRAVRHLPRRSDAAERRLRRGQAAGGRRLQGRSCPRRPAAASPPIIPATAPTPRRSRARRSRLRGLRLRRRAERLLRAACSPSTIPNCSPTNPTCRARGRRLRRQVPRARQLPRRHARRDAGRRALRRRRDLSRFLLGPARARRARRSRASCSPPSRG